MKYGIILRGCKYSEYRSWKSIFPVFAELIHKIFAWQLIFHILNGHHNQYLIFHNYSAAQFWGKSPIWVGIIELNWGSLAEKLCTSWWERNNYFLFFLSKKKPTVVLIGWMMKEHLLGSWRKKRLKFWVLEQSLIRRSVVTD